MAFRFRDEQSRAIWLNRLTHSSTKSAPNYFASSPDFRPNHFRFLGLGSSDVSGADFLGAGAAAFGLGWSFGAGAAASFAAFLPFSTFSSTPAAASAHSRNATAAESLLR